MVVWHPRHTLKRELHAELSRLVGCVRCRPRSLGGAARRPCAARRSCAACALGEEPQSKSEVREGGRERSEIIGSSHLAARELTEADRPAEKQPASRWMSALRLQHCEILWPARDEIERARDQGQWPGASGFSSGPAWQLVGSLERPWRLAVLAQLRYTLRLRIQPVPNSLGCEREPVARARCGDGHNHPQRSAGDHRALRQHAQGCPVRPPCQRVAIFWLTRANFALPPSYRRKRAKSGYESDFDL